MHVPIPSCLQQKARALQQTSVKPLYSFPFYSMKPELFSGGGHGTLAQFGWACPRAWWEAVTAAKCWSEPALHTLLCPRK